MQIGKAFTDHPASVGETYLEHLRSALGYSSTMIKGALCCAVHAFFPFLFVRTGSVAIEDLHRRMIRERSKRTDMEPANSERAVARSRERAAA